LTNLFLIPFPASGEGVAGGRGWGGTTATLRKNGRRSRMMQTISKVIRAPSVPQEQPHTKAPPLGGGWGAYIGGRFVR
jgi:hypothetical protein